MLRFVKGKIGSLLLFIAVFALSRIPGMLSKDFANFSAAYALAFCAGVYFTGAAAWWVPMTAMLLTDVGLNMYYWLDRGINVWEPHALIYQLFNYVAYAALILLGRRFKPRSPFISLLGGGLLGAVLFYLITNTASWLFNPFHSPEYTRNLAGWIKALTQGISGWPETWQFFRNTLLGSGLFTGLFVGAMKMNEATAESPAEKEAGARDEESDPEEAPEQAQA